MKIITLKDIVDKKKDKEMSELEKIETLKKHLQYDSIFNNEYYFKINGKLQEVLNNQFKDMGFRFVNAVVYDPKTQKLKAECFHVFNVMYYEFENKELKNACKQLYEKLTGENNEKRN